jgi:hypothetical protein
MKSLEASIASRPASDVTSSMSVAALFLETSEARMGVRKPSRSRKPRACAVARGEPRLRLGAAWGGVRRPPPASKRLRLGSRGA